jgi:hypothetical protein
MLREHRLRVSLNNLLFWRTLVALNASAFRLSPRFDLLGVQREFFAEYGTDPADEAYTIISNAIQEQVRAVLSGELDQIGHLLALQSEGEQEFGVVLTESPVEARDRDRHAIALTLALVGLSLAVASFGAAWEPAWRQVALAAAVPTFAWSLATEVGR